MNTSFSSPSAESKGPFMDPLDDPQFADLLEAGSVRYCAPVGSDVKNSKFLEGRKIQPILIPSNYGSSRGGKTDTAGSPEYLFEALGPTLKAGGADVKKKIIIPVNKIVKGMVPPEFEKVKNASFIVKIMKEAMRAGYDSIMKGNIPLFLGGDHTSKLAATGAVLMANPDPENPGFSTAKDIHGDGHPDALEEPEIIGNAHGRTRSTLMGMGPADLMPVMEGVPLLKPKNGLYLGCHNADPEEMRSILKHRSPFLGLQGLESHPELALKFLANFVQGNPYNFTCDLDLMSRKALMINMGKEMHPGAPMATLEGMQSNMLFNICNALGRAQTPQAIEFSEVAPLCDKEQGGLTRDHAVIASNKILGGGNSEYHIEYEPFSA